MEQWAVSEHYLPGTPSAGSFFEAIGSRFVLMRQAAGVFRRNPAIASIAWGTTRQPWLHRTAVPVLAMMRVSILIAEDDALLHSLLSDILDREEDLEVVGVAEDGHTCLEIIERLHPMVVLLDLRLPGLSGQRVLSLLLEQPDPPAVLVLSGEDDENTQVEVARSGALGFLPKREAATVLPRAIRAVSKGEVWFTPQVARRIVQEHQELVRHVRNEQRPLNRLTPREQDVLSRVARGLTNRQIAAELFMSVHTVKLHIANILRKLGLPNRTEAAVFAVREGLVEDGAAPTAA